MALTPVDVALARILAAARVSDSELIQLADGVGRVLAKDIIAKRDQPPFQSSAMDGFAIRHEDLHLGQSDQSGTSLKLVGVAAAGHAFKGRVRSGEAVRILTGAPLPKGADTVVIQENTRLEGAVVAINEAPALGRNIRPQGLDFKKGEVLITAGTKLNARDIGVIAAANVAMIRVRKKPRVVLFTTGDELVLPGERPRPDQIVSSNSHALAALAAAWSAEVVNLGIIRDSLKATQAAIAKAKGTDILITTGGASVGDHDYVQAAMKSSGIKIDFWKIALRPGKPLMFGQKGKLLVLGLPGNPVSALVCAQVFLRPLLAKMQGTVLADDVPLARLTTALPGNDGRQDYIRAKLNVEPSGARMVTAFSKQDSSMQRTLRESDCLIMRPPHAAAAAVGEVVPIMLLDF